MRLAIAKTLKKGDKVLVNKNGREVVLARDAEYSVLDKLVMLEDCFDGRRYVHTECRPFPKKPAKKAAVYFF